MEIDFTSVTEIPGALATQEQRSRLYQRYRFASRYAEGKRVLEVSCGAGLGLGHLGRESTLIVGADYSNDLLRIARSHYRQSIPLIRLDAHKLPFGSGTFDLIVNLEAIYYFKTPERFVAESLRVLSPRGLLLIGMVNGDWPELSPSLYSTTYLSASDLHALLRDQGFERVDFFAGFPTKSASAMSKLISFTRRAGAKLNLVPKTLKGRERLKRLFYGPLKPLESEVREGMADMQRVVPISIEDAKPPYKIVYAVARTTE